MSFVQRLQEATDTWLTPRWILDPLGHFDLDPCACPLPRPWETAARSFALPEDDGLKKPWTGRVWLNPPYGNKAGVFVARLAEHGDGIALIFARTETEFWQEHIFPKADAVLFLRGRVKFCDAKGKEAEPAPAPAALIAYGAANVNSLHGAGFNGYLARLPRSN